MIQSNTIAFYDNLENEYARKTLKADMSRIYSKFQCYLPAGATILDAGCGSGRDSLYFTNAGYKVTAMDASKLMCEETSKLIKCPVLHKAFEELEFDNCFAGVWACASLLHVSYVELPCVFQKICKSLSKGGILYASWKYGSSERIEESSGRFFCDMDEDRVNNLIKKIPGFSILEYWISKDVREETGDQSWFNLIAKKDDNL